MSKKLLIISSVWVEPNSSAAGNRMLQLIELFQENNFEVYYASTASISDFGVNLSQLNCLVHQIELNNSSFDNFILELNPNVVLFDRFMVEEQFGWRVAKTCPNAMRILDTEDLHFLRLARQECIKKSIDFSIDYLLNFDTAKREIASIYRCDISLIISKYEVDLLLNHFKIPENLLLYLPLFGNKNNDILDFDTRKDFVFIGNFLHEPNWDAVQQLSKNIWNTIHKKLPNAKMQIYGAYPSQKVFQLHNSKSNFIINGRAENALNVISNAKVLLAPLRFGAGIKGKFIEAMQTGTPTVTTSIGAEAMTLNNSWNGLIANDFEEFAQNAIQLYTDENLWEKSQQTGFEILSKEFNKDVFQNLFSELIQKTMLNLPQHRNQNFIGKMLQFHTANSYYYMSKWIEEKNKN